MPRFPLKMAAEVEFLLFCLQNTSLYMTHDRIEDRPVGQHRRLAEILQQRHLEPHLPEFRGNLIEHFKVKSLISLNLQPYKIRRPMVLCTMAMIIAMVSSHLFSFVIVN